MHFIPSKLNPADRPSREVDMMETTLSEESAREINIVFGPHSVDLMASESNVHRFFYGVPLRYLSKNKTPSSSGVNVFAQNLSRECNPYVFPLFALIFTVLRYLG